MYIDGLSITLGSPRKHVWTYAVGFSETGSTALTHNCSCAATPGGVPPSFIGHDYYCESGFVGAGTTTAVCNTSDPLWDSSGCVLSNTNCCVDANIPWF